MNKPKFSKKYTAMINRAVAIARHDGAALIERRHLITAICGMAPKLFSRLLGCKQLMFVGELPLNAVVNLEPCKIPFSRESYRVLSVFGGCLGKVMDEIEASEVELQHVAAALILDDCPDSPVHELLSVNGISVNKAIVMEALKRIGRNGIKRRKERQVYRTVASIRKRLMDGVVGQGAAISKICDSLLGNWLRPHGDRTTPLVLTIVGRSGTGKTLIANILSEAVAQNCDGSIAVLNGGLFASENTAHDVIGYDSGWKGGARIGTFTGPVINNPNAIIIIENFDLLNPIARSHIMRAITTGRLKDDMVGHDVSFRKATIILVTSAGCDCAYFDDTNADKTRARMVEELTNGISDQNRRDNVTSLAGVSNEVVMLKELTIDELRQVFIRAIEDEIFSIKKSVSKKVVIDARRLADVLIEGISSLNPSEVAPMVKANVGDPIRKAIMEAKCPRVKSVEVEVDSGGEVDINTVAKNLAMRKRRLVSASTSIEESRLVLHIRSGDFVLLPAVTDGFIRILPPKAGDTFDKLVGLEKPIAVLRHCIRYLHGETNINPGGGGFLFRGGPGTGKSCLARCLAYEAGLPYVLLNCAELISPEVITNVFNKLRLYGKGGLIVIFEEIDAIGGDRDDNKSPAYVERLNLLLENIDGMANDPECRIVYVGLTNRMEAMDSALLRDGRFGRVINFRGLNMVDRRKLLAMEISECGISPAPDEELLDFMARTTEDMAGSMLKAIVHELALLASESKPITREMYAKARQIVVHGESTTTVRLDDEQLYSCGVHEAGHALACDATGRDFVQASIVEDGSSHQGYVESSDKTRCTSASILDSIDVALAGLAGQEVMGLPPSGGESDLRQAKDLAFGYIRNGFCREWGLLYLEEPDEKMKTLASKIIDERYRKVFKMLLDAKPILSRFAKLLVERKTLFHDDLRMIKKSLAKKGSEYGNEA